jgi:hypothetical protein
MDIAAKLPIGRVYRSPSTEKKMTVLAPSTSPSRQLTVAAEGIAAAQFARCGFDVSIQYGPNKPKYDLFATKAGSLLTVCVMGSLDGSWDITQYYLKRSTELSGKKVDHQRAIELWLDRHGARAVCCFVQFQGVAIDRLPRIYLASPKETAQKLREIAERYGNSILYDEFGGESYNDTNQTIGKIPAAWRFSNERIQELLDAHEAKSIPMPQTPEVDLPTPIWISPDVLPRERKSTLAICA